MSSDEDVLKLFATDRVVYDADGKELHLKETDWVRQHRLFCKAAQNNAVRLDITRSGFDNIKRLMKPAGLTLLRFNDNPWLANMQNNIIIPHIEKVGFCIVAFQVVNDVKDYELHMFIVHGMVEEGVVLEELKPIPFGLIEN